jgi:hypothetical protein
VTILHEKLTNQFYRPVSLSTKDMKAMRVLKNFQKSAARTGMWSVMLMSHKYHGAVGDVSISLPKTGNITQASNSLVPQAQLQLKCKTVPVLN